MKQYMFEFEKFMKDLDRRNRVHIERQKALQEQDDFNGSRELDKLYKEKPQNVIVYRPEEGENA